MRRLCRIILSSLCLTAVSAVYANSVSLEGDEAVTNLRWRSGAIRLAISASLLRENPNIKKDSDVAGAIKRSIETWSRVANIDLVQIQSDKLNASPSGAAGDGISLVTVAATAENVLLFAKDPENAAATTRVFYNRRGLITEADIVLNPYQQFSTDGTLGTFDLESTLTHEMGHLLGLQHSLVLGSTMHANYGKNGVFGLQSIGSRNLSPDDIAAVRSIYGVRSEEDCCGVIEGRLSFTTKQTRNIQLWVEDTSGVVQASVKAAPDGTFRIGGLVAGKYRVFAQEQESGRVAVPVRDLGELVVSNGETTPVSAKIGTSPRDFEVRYVGLSGQLSEMAVSLSPGRSYMLYLGGRNLDPRSLSIGFTSPHISAVQSTMRSLDYGDEVSVISFEIRIGERASHGDYSIYVESERGDRRAIVGGVTVESSSTQWYNPAIFEE